MASAETPTVLRKLNEIGTRNNGALLLLMGFATALSLAALMWRRA